MRSATLRVLLVCLVGWTAAAWPQQIISNPGFETIGPKGFPADWEPVGQTASATRTAHNGQYALRFVRKEGPSRETGLNREWKAHSGSQGKMLSVLKGGIRFWYKAVSARDCHLRVYVIPMSEAPIEGTGSKRADFDVPAHHVGDGQWHEGALKYDFTDNPKVKWAHVAVRLVGAAGEMLFDDVRWVERVGPQIALAKPRLFEVPGSAGEQCMVAVDLLNSGDAPVTHARASLTLPDGLAAAPEDHAVAQIGLDGEAVLQWTVTGVRKPGVTIGIRANAGALDAATALRLDPELEFISLAADRFLLEPGDTIPIRARVRNVGSAAFEGLALDAIELRNCRVASNKLRCARVLPGQTVELKSAVTVQSPGEATVNFQCEGAEPPLRTIKFVVTPAVQARPRQLFGPVWVRETGSGAIGELRAGGQCVAKVPHLAKVHFRNKQGQVEVVAPKTSQLEPVVDSAGARWRFRLHFDRLSPRVTRFRCAVACDQPRDVLAFEAMHLYVGEGVPDAKRPEAIFAGLEWLVDDEISSSTLDIERDHPHRIRYVPHPNMVPIPYMAAATGRGVVGLLWDVHHQWDGSHDRTQPVFASPARFEGRSSHLMGLIAPNVVAGLEPNERLALKQPYPLPAGRELVLVGEIFADPAASDPLVVQDAWFKHHRPDPVMPVPQGSYAKWFEFSMIAYQKTLVDPETGMWLPFLGGPSLWRKPRPRPDICWELLCAAQVTQDSGLAKRYRALAAKQLDVAGAQAKSFDMGFDYAGVAGLLPRLAANAAATLRGRDAQGAWRFNANRRDQGVFKGRDYHGLGEHGAVELGTCALKAYTVLRYARMAGDVPAYAAAVKTLELMERFRVPRAAQVWEVPVHTPDILAASDAVDAYLEAYQFSGNERWLAQAKRWARAGLPFIYVWNDERYPWMRYGSIPVFGATWFRGSWFGRLVQWNGLRYAYALLKLHRHAPKGYAGMTWQEWARGITHSAMYQQSAEQENYTLWPDAYNCLDAKRARWDFAPTRIVKNVCTLIGREAEPQTVILAQGDERAEGTRPAAIGQREPGPRVHVSSGAQIRKAAWSGERLTVALRYPPQQSGYTLIASMDRPSRVTLNGQTLQERRDLADPHEPGYAYHDVYASLTVRTISAGDATLVVDGVRHRPCRAMPQRVTRIAFEFAASLEGWQPAHHFSSFEAREGWLVAEVNGKDPYMVRQECRVAPNTVEQIVVRMRVSAGRAGQFFWTTVDSPQFGEDKALRYAVTPDGQFHEYKLDVARHPLWKGQTITSIRLDPTSVVEQADVAVDYIRGR